MTHLGRSTLIIAIFFVLEKVLGFVRHVLVARQFQLSAELDAFNAANNIPDLLFSLISGGALAMAFIPVLSEYLEKQGRPAVWELFSRVANLVFLTTASLSLIVALFAEVLVRRVITPGFSEAQQHLVANLMRLDLVATLIFSLGGLVIAGLQANQHFLLPALALSMYDLGMMFGVTILAPENGYQIGSLTLPALNQGVYGLAYGTILGAALFLCIQVPGLVRYHFRWRAAVSLRHPGVRQVLLLMAPRALTVLCIQLVFLTQDNIASRLEEGAVSALVYGWLFMQVPETLIGTAIGTALLPTLSEQLSRQDTEGYRLALNRAARVILAFTISGMALLMVGIRPLVSILNFDTAGTDMVVWTTRGFLVGLIGHALLEVATRAFYARQNAVIPLLASGTTTLVFVGLAVMLSRGLGVAGISLANALAYTGNALVLWYLLGRRIPDLLQVGGTLQRAIPAAVLGALVVFGLLRLPVALPGLFLGIGALVVGGLVVLPFIWAELRLLVKL